MKEHFPDNFFADFERNLVRELVDRQQGRVSNAGAALVKKYYLNVSEEILWKNANITFDASALLDILGLEPELRIRLFEILETWSERLWLTRHSVFEFERNLNDVLARVLVGKITDCDKFSSAVDTYIESAQNLVKLGKDLDFELPDFQNVKDSLLRYQNCLPEKICSLAEQITNEKKEILQKVVDLFHRVSPSDLAEATLQPQIEERKSSLLPPYCKKDESKTDNKHGDIVVWEQIIEMACRQSQSIVFVVNDAKENWLLVKEQGAKVGPRPELLDEFCKRVPGQNISLIGLQRFIHVASKMLDLKDIAVSPEPEGNLLDSEKHEFHIMQLPILGDLENAMNHVDQVPLRQKNYFEFIVQEARRESLGIIVPGLFNAIPMRVRFSGGENSLTVSPFGAVKVFRDISETTQFLDRIGLPRSILYAPLGVSLPGGSISAITLLEEFEF
ncbi:MAG: hypothetical protein K2X27_17530 [Candidatus Obscuribacterales bacterium]|nr:hypothetical protein [Candidatus Obscuribacterales bacterium]